MNRRRYSGLFLSTIVLVMSACSSDPPPFAIQPLYGKEVTNLVYEVAYMKGAAPSVGTTAGGSPIWGILETNISTLLQGKIKVTVPTTLGEMKEIPAEKKDYSNDDIVRIAQANRTRPSLEGNTASIYVIFVDGFFTVNGVQNGKRSGVTSVGDGAIAISVKATVSPEGVEAKLGQQLALIHETGHALGLVNNGVALTTKHEDSTRGLHCTNSKCIMNSKLDAGLDTILEYYINPSATLPIFFGPECIADIKAAFH